VPLELYLEMGVFYLEESEPESVSSHQSRKSYTGKRRIIRKPLRKERKNTNETQIDETYRT